jgi:elongation factor P--(R)-beta-lysine ligase
MNAQLPWWDRERYADKRGFLQARGRIKSAMRSWFEREGFNEVETNQLQVSPGNETHLHGLATQRLSPDGQTIAPFYLHTSPEFSCKKLLAAGETQIFEFARVFRNREAGPLHATEFTMLEWYRAHAEWTVVIDDALALLKLAATAIGATHYSWRGHSVAIDAQPKRLSLQQAFLYLAQIDLLATLDDQGMGKLDALAAAADSVGIATADDDTWSDLFSKILVQKIEPYLGFDAPCILCDYPACEAALARRSPQDPRIAERFELYVCGVELANGFGELTDPVEQRARFEADMAQKQAIYGETYPIDEDFIAALSIMPPASGVALGFDRLVMLASGARRIDDVMWTGVV